MKRINFLYCLFIVIPTLLNAAPKQGIQAISEATLRAHVEFLASPELEGRDALEAGSRIAERYIATRLAQYGLNAFEDLPDYYQPVPLRVSMTDYEKSRLIVKSDGGTEEFIPNQDIFFFPRGGRDADITGALLLCGYGISAPEFDYDDFSGTDPAGKILLVIDGEPLNPDGTALLGGGKKSKYANPVVKARIAQEAGAAGLLIMPAPSGDRRQMEKSLGRYMARMNDPIVQLAEETEALPVFYLTEETGKILLSDLNLLEYQRQIDSQRRGDPRLVAGTGITLRIRFKNIEEKTTANVVAYWPGKSEEAVLVVAHHDHEGKKGDDIYYGADDNASGVAGLLGIAQAVSACGELTGRQIIFLSTGAEERGSLGAQYFIHHPPIALDNIVAVINMDEIGRDGSPQFRAMTDSTIQGVKDLLMVFYSGQTPELADIVTLENQSEKLDLELEPVLQFHGSSDHTPFHEQQIPSVFLFTGFHSDYTSPRDTADKILYGKLTRVTQLAFGLTYDLATRKQRPLFDTSIKEITSSGRRYGY